ncbi:WD40 repeat domain-containing protein [Kitasatospora sp. NPDC059646]|uniref:WD40 repeat domain-containing protein n=1 Tax=Kitasatospora sp. NPDC059646 TaxID=3346893 RepID=UPI0036CB9312
MGLPAVPGRRLTERPAAALDLDPATPEDRAALAADLRSYLRKLLPPRRFPDPEVRAIADRIADYSDHGAFLVAALYADHLLTAAGRGTAGPPCTITEVFDLHVDALAAADPWVRPVLTVLGRARGHGMPLDLLHAAALAHRPPAADRPTPQLADTRRVLTKAAFYLRTTPDTDHRLLYRYFHQALVEHTGPDVDPAVLHHSLLAADGAPVDWRRAQPYLLRHAAEHAVAAGGDALDRLLHDPRFLVHADPDTLGPLLHHATTRLGAEHAHVYRTTVAHDPRRHRVDVRRDLLALDAAGWRRPELSAAFTKALDTGDGPRPTVRWATRQSHPSRLHTLTGHTRTVTAAATATAPDGTPLAVTTGSDHTAMVWNLTTGSRLHTLRGHRHSVEAVVTVAGTDGTPLAVTAGQDGDALVWNLTTGSRLHTLRATDFGFHGVALTSVAALVLPDGARLVVTGGANGLAEVWDLATGERLRTFFGHRATVTTVVTAVLPHGRPLVVTGGEDNSALVWDPTTGDRLHQLVGHHDVVTAAAVSTTSNGTPVVVTTSRDHSAIVWNLRTGETLHRLSALSTFVAAPAGLPVAVTAGGGRDAVVWDLATGTRRHTLTGHTAAVTSAVTTTAPDGTPLAVTTSRDRSAMVWNLRTGERLHVLTSHTDWVGAAAAGATRGGTPLVVTAGRDRNAIVWDLSTGTSLRTRSGHIGEITSIEWTEAGPEPLILTASRDRSAIVWDARTGERRRTLSGHTRAVTSVATTAARDGSLRTVTSAEDHTALVWNPLTGERLNRLAGHDGWISPIAAATAPDGTPFAVTVDYGTPVVRYLDPGSGSQAFWRQSGTPIHALAVTRLPGGRQVLVTAGRNGTASVWDLETFDLRLPLVGHTGDVTALALTEAAGGARLAVTVGDDRTAIVWDLARGTALHRLTGHLAEVLAVAVVPGPRGRPLVVTGSRDRTAVVWDLASGHRLHTLLGHTGRVTAVAGVAGPGDGRAVVTTGFDRTAVLWDLATGRALHRWHLPFEGSVARTAPGGFLLAYGQELAYFSCS